MGFRELLVVALSKLLAVAFEEVGWLITLGEGHVVCGVYDPDVCYILDIQCPDKCYFHLRQYAESIRRLVNNIYITCAVCKPYESITEMIMYQIFVSIILVFIKLLIWLLTFQLSPLVIYLTNIVKAPFM